MEKKISPKIIALTFSVLVVCFSVISFINAVWQPPVSNPPDDNVPAPINAGLTAQGKMGNLGLGTLTPGEKLDVVGNITAQKYIDKDSTGYYLDPATGSVLNWIRESADGTGSNPRGCPAGQAIQKIAEDGKVTCVAITSTPGPQGPQGPQGSQGTPGPQGPTYPTPVVCEKDGQNFSIGYKCMPMYCYYNYATCGSGGGYCCSTSVCTSSGQWSTVLEMKSDCNLCASRCI